MMELVFINLTTYDVVVQIAMQNNQSRGGIWKISLLSAWLNGVIFFYF